jgi:DNA-binding transcriptional regulator YiaG
VTPKRRFHVLSGRPRAAGGVPLSPAEIRDLRGPRTRKAFATQLGVSVATVYLWEAGRMRASAPNLARLRRLLAVLQRTRARAARS